MRSSFEVADIVKIRVQIGVSYQMFSLVYSSEVNQLVSAVTSDTYLGLLAVSCHRVFCQGLFGISVVFSLNFL